MNLSLCGCGGHRMPHSLGSESCFRVPCPAPVKISDDLWQVDGGTPINSFTLTNSRLYAMHADGSWSKPKRPTSEPSLRG